MICQSHWLWSFPRDFPFGDRILSRRFYPGREDGGYGSCKNHCEPRLPLNPIPRRYDVDRDNFFGSVIQRRKKQIEQEWEEMGINMDAVSTYVTLSKRSD
jgi:hypothetical protein